MDGKLMRKVRGPMLLNDGGGGGDPYQIKINSVENGGEEQSMGYEEIMQLLHGLKPGDMTAAARSFKKLGETLDRVTAKLASTGNQLADSWSGEAASKAMTKFQELHDQAAQLAAQAHTTSNTMNWMGTEVMPKFQSLPTPQVMGKSEADAAMGAAAGPGGSLVGAGLGAMGIGPDGKAKADKAAREYMKSFSQAMTQANGQLPESTAGPKSRGGTGTINPSGGSQGTGGTAGISTGSGYSGVGGTNGTGGGTPSSYTPPAATSGHVNLSKLSHGTNTPGGSLQGYSPAGGTPSPSTLTHGNMNQPSPNSFTPVMTPGGSGSSGRGLPGEGEGDVPGEEGLGKNGVSGEEGAAGERALGDEGLKTGKGLGEEGVPGEEGLGADGAASDAAGTVGADGAAADGAAGAAGEAAGAEGAAGAAEGEGMNAMPMGGAGGGGQSDKERQRQAWMPEDESIWGAPTEATGPVIE